MFEYFHFSLPRAVTEQLVERLAALTATPLNESALRELQAFQSRSKTCQGVYVIYHEGAAAYAGKAENTAERLFQHLAKLSGRSGMDMSHVGFKALLLDENWSTSANEDLLIGHFKKLGECRWNGIGFGPKDPGKNRDGSKPNWFDDTYPVREDYPVGGLSSEASILEVLAAIKARVPYLFRYEVPVSEGSKILRLKMVPQTARDLACHAAAALGDGWQLMLFKNGFTLYKAVKSYEHGIQLHPPKR
ncbi:MAG TPA: hypothetical protein DIT13_02205 [Verrucomicrobiales bacterium]|nr:hypothetical protein [Verrucomicrobiales bacterium]HRJ10325.1 hypothetical protein [Prosthecobacter sp.]HRK16981.1 hypothetical protein [Prosthecobacter sp.]